MDSVILVEGEDTEISFEARLVAGGSRAGVPRAYVCVRVDGARTCLRGKGIFRARPPRS